MTLRGGLVSYSDPLSYAILAFWAIYNNRHTHSTHSHMSYWAHRMWPRERSSVSV